MSRYQTWLDKSKLELRRKKTRVNGVSGNGSLAVITVHEHTAKQVVLTHITLELNERFCFKEAAQMNISYYKNRVCKAIWVCPFCNPYQWSGKVSQVLTSVNQNRQFESYLLYQVLPSPHWPCTSFPKAAAQWGGEGPQV